MDSRWHVNVNEDWHTLNGTKAKELEQVGNIGRI